MRSDERNDSVRNSYDCFRLWRFEDCGISFYAARKIACEMLRWELAGRASRGQFTATLLVFNQHASTGKKLVNFINQPKWFRSTISVAVRSFTLIQGFSK